MTRISLRPYLHLIDIGKASTLARDLAEDLPAEIIEALLRANLLQEGPPPEEFPCGGGGNCSRVIIPYMGPEKYDYRAVPPDRSSCCGRLDLMACEIRTFLAPESGLIRMCSEWLGIDVLGSEQLFRAMMVQRIGTVRGSDGCMPVFFARRLHTRASRRRLSELAAQGPSLVLALLRDGLPLELQDRYAPEGAMQFAFVEDILDVVNGEVAITAPHPLDATASSGVRALPSDDRPICRLLTLDGERRLTQRELDRERAAMSKRDLFVDFTASAKAGGIAAWVRKKPGAAQTETILKPLEGKILLEYVRNKGKPLNPDRLRCIRRADIKDGMRRFRDLRSKIDLKYSRDHYRLFHSCKGESLYVTEYFLQPPAGFSMAILLPLDRDESEQESAEEREVS